VEERHYFKPGDHRPFLARDPFSAIIGPRPIGWISSLSRSGSANLAPYSFFNAFNYHPPIIGFASVGWKDTVANISETGEFGWNLASEPLASAMNVTSAAAGPDIDEFKLAGLDKAPAREIAAPLVAQSPVSFECRLTQTLRLETAAGQQVDTWMVFGEVIGIHLSPEALVDGSYVTARGRPLLRAGGQGDYFTIDAANRFIMLRP